MCHCSTPKLTVVPDGVAFNGEVVAVVVGVETVHVVVCHGVGGVSHQTSNAPKLFILSCFSIDARIKCLAYKECITVWFPPMCGWGRKSWKNPRHFIYTYIKPV